MPGAGTEVRVRAGEAAQAEKDRVQPRALRHATTDHRSGAASGVP